MEFSGRLATALVERFNHEEDLARWVEPLGQMTPDDSFQATLRPVRRGDYRQFRRLLSLSTAHFNA
jgi:hypothetical protein